MADFDDAGADLAKGVVVGIAVRALHDHLVPHLGGVGQPGDTSLVAAGHERGGGDSQAGCTTGGDVAGLDADELGQATAGGALQLDDIDIRRGGFGHGGDHFGPHQGAADDRHRTPGVDDAFHPQVGIHRHSNSLS